MTSPLQRLAELHASAKFGPLTCDNYFPSEIFEQTANGPAKAIEIRGWGWLQKQEDGEQVQDARGRLVHAALANLPALLECANLCQIMATSLANAERYEAIGEFRMQIADDMAEALKPLLTSTTTEATAGEGERV
jgi:hypothetical protein